MRCPQLPASLVLGLSLSLTPWVRGEGPADGLFRLVPPDAGVTLAIEDLRDHAREFFSSPLSDGLRRLPAVRDWLASDHFKELRKARRHFEGFVGGSLAAIRDDLLGDAVVLTLQLPPGGREDEARGLLLVRVRDRRLLDRLLRGMNDAEQKGGQLLRVVDRSHGGGSYQVREFAPGSKRPPEYYATLDGNVFAWSNSEAMVRGVIDRQAGRGQGLGDDPKFRRVRQGLPGRALASLFVNPRVLESILAAEPKPPKPEDEKVVALLGAYLATVEYAGAALELRDGVILHTEETLDAEKIAPWFRRWAARPAIEPRLDRIPASALAVASAHVDFEAILDAVRDLTPATERKRLENILLALSGISLGNDVKSAILPRLGPGVLGYLEAQEAKGPRFAAIATVDLGGDARVAAALDNALRTVLALYAVDKNHGGGQLEVESTEARGTKVTALRPSTPFAYAVGPDRLILGRSAEAVARALALASPPAAGFARLRETYFPAVTTFVCFDLDAIQRFAEAHRDTLARRIAAKHQAPVEEATRDLDRVLALTELFRDAFLTNAIAPDARSIHRMAGLIARDSASSPAPAPGSPRLDSDRNTP